MRLHNVRALHAAKGLDELSDTLAWALRTETSRSSPMHITYESRTLDELVAALTAEGMQFRQFECVSEGEYSPDDAAWNYMDIPHLTYVHKQVDGVLSLAADQITGSVFFQRIPFFRLPLTVLVYQSSPDTVTYHTSFGFFLLIIQTSWAAIDATHTRVVTRYAVGWTGWLVGLLYPVIKKTLQRNYRILMSEDVPMRQQRGLLRRKGYGFRIQGDVPSFLESRKIMQQNVVAPVHNVVAPRDLPPWPARTIEYEELEAGRPVFVGDADHLGLAVVRVGSVVNIYPRLCPHEGAGLDTAVCQASLPGVRSCAVQCPWHGRKFRPILAIDLPATKRSYETDWHAFVVGAANLRISCKHPEMSEDLRRSDWSRPAAERTS